MAVETFPHKVNEVRKFSMLDVLSIVRAIMDRDDVFLATLNTCPLFQLIHLMSLGRFQWPQRLVVGDRIIDAKNVSVEASEMFRHVAAHELITNIDMTQCTPLWSQPSAYVVKRRISLC